MSPISIIAISLITIAVIVGFTIFILVVALRKKPDDPLNVDYISSNKESVIPTVSRINWTENLRGYSSNIFPPCFDLSGELKKVYAILKSYNLEKKYFQLLDVFSIILCQDTQVRDRDCPDSFINDRLADLNTMGGDANDQNAIVIVKANTNLNNNKIGKLLVMATSIIEKYMKEIKADTLISSSDKEQIEGFKSFFYRQHYDYINKRCP